MHADDTKMRTLEKTTKNLKSEKSALNIEVTTMRDQLSSKDKDLRRIKEDLGEAKDEVTRLSDK